MEAIVWKMSLRALNVIKLNRIVFFSLASLVLCLFGCAMFSKSIITSGGNSPLSCFMNLEGSEGVIARITIINTSNRPIYIDERYVQGQICYRGIKILLDSCVVTGIDPVDPPLMINPKFIKLQSKEKYVFSFENRGVLAENISMKVRVPFFLGDSVFTKIHQNELNSSVFLEANILSIEWQDVVKSGRYPMNPYSFIQFSERGW